MTHQLVLYLLAMLVIADQSSQVRYSAAAIGVQTAPSLREIDDWLKRDLRTAGAHDVSRKTPSGVSGDKYEIERIGLSDCRLTIRQTARHYVVMDGERMNVPNQQVDAAEITLKDLDIGRLGVRQAPSFGNPNIPSFLVELQAIGDRGDAFIVESAGYQGGPKKGPGRRFGLRVGHQPTAAKAVEMFQRAAVLCGAPDVPLPSNTTATGAPRATSAAPPTANPTPSAANSGGMTNDQVIQMVAAGLSEQVVIMSIRQATTRAFDLSTAGLIGLKKAGVSDAVIAAMQAGGAQ